MMPKWFADSLGSMPVSYTYLVFHFRVLFPSHAQVFLCTTHIMVQAHRRTHGSMWLVVVSVMRQDFCLVLGLPLQPNVFWANRLECSAPSHVRLYFSSYPFFMTYDDFLSHKLFFFFKLLSMVTLGIHIIQMHMHVHMFYGRK